MSGGIGRGCLRVGAGPPLWGGLSPQPISPFTKNTRSTARRRHRRRASLVHPSPYHPSPLSHSSASAPRGVSPRECRSGAGLGGLRAPQAAHATVGSAADDASVRGYQGAPAGRGRRPRPVFVRSVPFFPCPAPRAPPQGWGARIAGAWGGSGVSGGWHGPRPRRTPRSARRAHAHFLRTGGIRIASTSVPSYQS